MDEGLAPIGSLVSSIELVSPYIKVKKVAERFFQERHLDAVAVVDCNEPVGLVTRNKLLFTLFRRFGFELYERKPIMTISDNVPMIVHRDERMDVALDMAMARPFDDIYDDIIVVDDNGHFSGLLSIKKVILEQSNAFANSIIQKEIAHAKAKEMEKVSGMKSQFIANVTHELRAPVNAIIGFSELIRISAEKGHMDQVRDRLALLYSSSVSLRAIITNILDLSKVEAGKMEIHKEVFDLGELLREVSETGRILIGQKPVEIEVIIHESPSFVIETDPIKLRQIAVNLLSNAAKFTDRGRIAIEAGRSAGGEVVISFSDTGIGIKQEDMDKLFSAFTQLEDAKTKRFEGTGLGLTITKHLADLLGGEIKLESVFGLGSKFTLTLGNERGL